MPLSADDIAELYRCHAAAMVTFFVRRTYDPDAAVDLVGETFATAIRDRRQFRGRTDDEALGWLWGVARHQLSGWYRRGQVERRAMERLGVERRALTDPEYERIVELGGLAELRGRVGERLARLSGDQRAAVTLRVVEERSYEEVAAALGTTEQTARARVSRGLRTLAAELANDDAPEVGARV